MNVSASYRWTWIGRSVEEAQWFGAPWIHVTFKSPAMEQTLFQEASSFSSRATTHRELHRWRGKRNNHLLWETRTRRRSREKNLGIKVIGPVCQMHRPIGCGPSVETIVPIAVEEIGLPDRRVDPVLVE